MCSVSELRPHASYVRHGLSVDAARVSALASTGDHSSHEPIVITRDRTIIDGYARCELARRLGQVTILCIEHNLSEAESLRWLIQGFWPSRGLNSYVRILLALDLELPLQEKARANQQAGGRNKGSSILTEVKPLDVRSEIASVACASTGNVTKVIQLRKTAHPDVEHAVRSGEISIHKAWHWSQESPEKQLEKLRLRRLERSLKKKARALVAEHRVKLSRSTPGPHPVTMLDLIRLLTRLSTMSTDESSAFGKVAIATLNVSGKGIYLTPEFLQGFRPQQERFAE
jgi:hypothetical protein